MSTGSVLPSAMKKRKHSFSLPSMDTSDVFLFFRFLEVLLVIVPLSSRITRIAGSWNVNFIWWCSDEFA